MSVFWLMTMRKQYVFVKSLFRWLHNPGILKVYFLWSGAALRDTPDELLGVPPLEGLMDCLLHRTNCPPVSTR